MRAREAAVRAVSEAEKKPEKTTRMTSNEIYMVSSIEGVTRDSSGIEV